MRRSCVLVVIAALLAACGPSTASPSSRSSASPSSTPTGASSSPGPTEAQTYPPVPAGGIDCGINDEISGWPTTTTLPASTLYSCLSDALSSGRPARFVLIQPSNVDGGSKTSDGYSIPAAILITYRVFGPNQLQITTDKREAGGSITTENCTGLSQPASGSSPTPSGCTPA
jgi:hypothetical protein